MSKQNLKERLSGKFIVLDGPDGCGKSTQLELLARFLETQGISVVKTNDPGGTKIGNQISNLLKYDAQGKMDVKTEAMLFMASRAQLVAEVVKPALETGKLVLCDRFISANLAYQGSAGYPVEKIIELGRYAVADTWSDLTIIIDLPAEKGRERTGQKPRQKTKINHKDAYQSYLFDNVISDRFDSRTLEYHRKVRKWFLKIKEYYPGIVQIIDADNSDIETVHKKIVEAVEQSFP